MLEKIEERLMIKISLIFLVLLIELIQQETFLRDDSLLQYYRNKQDEDMPNCNFFSP